MTSYPDLYPAWVFGFIRYINTHLEWKSTFNLTIPNESSWSSGCTQAALRILPEPTWSLPELS